MSHVSHSSTLLAAQVLPWLSVTALALGAGLCNGLLGAAGGILLVALLPFLTPPALLTPRGMTPGTPLGSHLDRRDLLATSMAVMLPVSAVSFLFYWLGGLRLSPMTLAALPIPAVLGGLAGAALLGRLPEKLLRKLFALLVVISGIRMVM